MNKKNTRQQQQHTQLAATYTFAVGVNSAERIVNASMAYNVYLCIEWCERMLGHGKLSRADRGAVVDFVSARLYFLNINLIISD